MFHRHTYLALISLLAVSACSDPEPTPKSTQDMGKGTPDMARSDMRVELDMRSPQDMPDQADMSPVPDMRPMLDMADMRADQGSDMPVTDMTPDMPAADMAPDMPAADMAPDMPSDMPADMAPPLVDTCAAPSSPVNLLADGSVLTISGDTASATADIIYPGGSSCQSAFNTQHKDNAYTFTAPADGVVFAEISEAANPTQYLLVYALEGPCAAQTGLSCSGIANDQITFPVKAGQDYTVVVDHDSINQASGYTLRLGYAIPPSNDTCATPIALNVLADGSTTSVTGNTLQATSTRDPNDGRCISATEMNPAPRELFYSFEAPATGTVEVSIDRASLWSSSLYVFNSCASTTDLACFPFNDGKVDVAVVQGQTYHVAVDGFGTNDGGSFELSARFVPPDQLVQPGETCNTATPLPMPAFNGVSQSFDMVLGTMPMNMVYTPYANDYLQPCAPPPLPPPAGTTSGGDGVYFFTATDTGKVRVTVDGADTVVYVYDSIMCSTNELVCDDSTQANGRFLTSVDFNVIAGMTYFVVVDMWASWSTISRNTVKVEYGTTLP